jgi:hypothetical protein
MSAVCPCGMRTSATSSRRAERECPAGSALSAGSVRKLSPTRAASTELISARSSSPNAMCLSTILPAFVQHAHAAVRGQANDGAPGPG